MFSQPVDHVGATRIFARRPELDRQLLVQWHGDREGSVDVLACAAASAARGDFGDAHGADMSRGPIGE